MCTTFFEDKTNSLVYFQLEVDYYSNEANKNELKTFS